MRTWSRVATIRRNVDCGMMMMIRTREWRRTSGRLPRLCRVVLVVVVVGLGAPDHRHPVTDAFGCGAPLLGSSSSSSVRIRHPRRVFHNTPVLQIARSGVDFPAAAAAAAAANKATALRSSSDSSRSRKRRCGSLSASSASSSDHNDDVDLTDTDTAANHISNNDDDVNFATASEDDDSKLIATVPSVVPSVATILQFAVPATGVWLCSPLLSLVDTSTVGLLAGTAAQAALNPATAITDYSARTMSFLYVATTNMVASSRGGGTVQQQDGEETDDNRNSSSSIDDTTTTTTRVLGALRLSLFVGAALGASLFLGAGPLLRFLIGVDTSHALDPAIFESALRYVRIRALGMPAAALIGTAQSACLGLHDARSPLRLILAASGVNLVLDVLLVGQPNAWVGGAAGAAWATIVSQYVAIGLFFRYLGHSGGGGGGTVGETDEPEPVHTRGLLAGKLSLRNLLRRPDTESTALFAPYVVPVTTTQVGRCSTYIAMGHVVSSSLGAVSMAANQIITAIFYTLIPIADSLSLTAQSFLPSVVAQRPSRERSAALRGTTRNLLKVAGLLGVLLAGIVACIPMGCRLFTTDAAVTALVRRIVPVLFVIFSLHGVFCGSEGILLAEKDLTFLGRMYAVYFTVVPYLMLRLKTAAKKASSTVDLTSVWNLFLAYQLVRITVWVGRVAWLQRRDEQQHAEKNRAPTAVR